MEETKAPESPSNPSPPSNQLSTETKRICLTCFDPAIQFEETKRCNHGIYAKHMTIWHSFIKKDGVETLHASPGHSTYTFCCLASLNPDRTVKLDKTSDPFEGNTPPHRLVRVDGASMETVMLTIDLCAKIVFAYLSQITISPFIQGSFPLYWLQQIVMGSEPSWTPKDIDFFIPHLSATRFEKLFDHLRRNFPIKVVSTSNSQLRVSIVFGDTKIPFDITNLRTGRTRHNVRDAADLSISKVQICPRICTGDDFSICKDGLWIVGEESVLGDIRSRRFTWWRAPRPVGFTHTLLHMMGIRDLKPSRTMEDLSLNLPMHLIDLMREVDPEVFGLEPEVMPGSFSKTPSPFKSRDDTLLMDTSLMGGTVRLCPSPLCEDWHYYLDFANRIWISDNITFCSPGLHPDHPRGNISILDLIAFRLLQDPKHEDKLLGPFHSSFLIRREEAKPTGLTALNIQTYSLNTETLGIYMICDVCGLEVTAPVYTHHGGEFDVCLSCAREYREGYYRHFYDHAAEAKVKRLCRRYHASVLRKKKYEERGFDMKTHVAEDPPNENVEYV